MKSNYARLTASEMRMLPAQKQAEVYDFVKFLKSRTRARPRSAKPGRSIRDLVGICKTRVTDLAPNHDKYLYE